MKMQSDVQGIIIGLDELQQRFANARTFNENVPAVGQQKVGYRLNAMEAYPDWATVGMLKLFREARQIGAAIQLERTETLEAARPAATVKTTYNPQPGM